MQARRTVRGHWGLSLILAVGYFPVHMAVLLLMGSWWWSFAERQYGRNLIVRRSGEVNIVRYGPGSPGMEFAMFDGSPRTVSTSPDGNQTPLEEYVVPSAVIPATEIAQVGDPALLGGLSNASAGNWFARRDAADIDRVYLEGYDFQTRRRLGYLSRRGWTEARPAPEDRWTVARPGETDIPHAFETARSNLGVDTYSGPGAVVLNQQRIPDRLTFAVAADGVWKIDLRARQTQRIADIPGVRALTRIAMIPAGRDQSRTLSVESLLLTTRTQLIVLDPVGGGRWEYPLPEDASRSLLQVAAVENGGLVLFRHLRNSGPHDNTYVRLWWLDKSGTVTRTFDTTPEPPPDPLVPHAIQGVGFGVTLPVPLFATVGWAWYLQGEARQDPETRRLERDSNALLDQSWYGFQATTAIIGAICAAVAVRRARRFGGAVPWQWGLFAFVLGLPGLIGLLYSKRRPEIAQCEWLAGKPLAVPPKLSTDLFAA